MGILRTLGSAIITDGGRGPRSAILNKRWFEDCENVDTEFIGISMCYSKDRSHFLHLR